jgi:hypothetical protein
LSILIAVVIGRFSSVEFHTPRKQPPARASSTSELAAGLSCVTNQREFVVELITAAAFDTRERSVLVAHPKFVNRKAKDSLSCADAHAAGFGLARLVMRHHEFHNFFRVRSCRNSLTRITRERATQANTLTAMLY